MEKGKLVMWHQLGHPKTPIAIAEKAHALLVGSELRVVEKQEQVFILAPYIGEILDTLVERMSCV